MPYYCGNLIKKIYFHLEMNCFRFIFLNTIDVMKENQTQDLICMNEAS